uniref:Class II major histocompatibility complex transactivator n=1 Tax=Erpetoichthys calabaricus TaxID=27687 RepID=A0A8C4SFL7_ERPCA
MTSDDSGISECSRTENKAIESALSFDLNCLNEDEMGLDYESVSQLLAEWVANSLLSGNSEAPEVTDPEVFKRKSNGGISLKDTKRKKKETKLTGGVTNEQSRNRKNWRKVKKTSKETNSPGPPTSGIVTFTPLQITPSAAQLSHIVQFPVTNFTVNGNTTIFTHCAHAPGTSGTIPTAFQVFQTFTTVPQPVINFPLANNVQSSNSAIVIVPSSNQVPPSGMAVTPSSPVAGTVVDSAMTSPVTPSAPLGSQSVLQESDMGEQVTLEKTLPAVQKPKEVEDCIKNMKAALLQDKEFFSESHYIQVPLIQKQIKIKTGKNNAKSQEKEFVILDMTERKKATIFPSQIFDPPKDLTKEGRVIALLGNAGMGKSTLVHKLCRDWAKGEFQQFDFIFRFECKRLNLPGKSFGLQKLLFELSQSPLSENAGRIFRFVLRNPQRILIMFDGFDDFQDMEAFLQSPANNSTKEVLSIKDLLSGLFQKKLLIGSTILFTARPKETLNQFLGKVDKIFELSGFCHEDIEHYMSVHFRDNSQYDAAKKKLEKNQFLHSLCHTPLMCKFICLLLEKFEMDKELPMTITGLHLHIVSQRLFNNVPMDLPTDKTQTENILKLCQLAWKGIQDHKSLLEENDFKCPTLKEFSLKSGVVTQYPLNCSGEEKLFGHTFSDLLSQDFMGALHLSLVRGIKGKTLVKLIHLQQKKKKPHQEWLDVVRRFLVGLLFQNEEGHLSRLIMKHEDLETKKDAILEYIKKVRLSELLSNRLLEYCHCVYETKNEDVIQHVAKNLPPELSFRGTCLAPLDVFVLQHLLRVSNTQFILDLQETGINLLGMKRLVELENVTAFRASIADTISLWEHLQQTHSYDLLKSTIQKFTINPFKASQYTDVEYLSLLVKIYKEKKLPMSTSSSTTNTCDDEVLDIPAVKDLRKLEFALGATCGHPGFSQLVDILPAFERLQHLDLETLTGNKIGDKEAEKLALVFPGLPFLEMLNLSQNCIGDRGAEKLAQAFPSLTSLKF